MHSNNALYVYDIDVVYTDMYLYCICVYCTANKINSAFDIEREGHTWQMRLKSLKREAQQRLLNVACESNVAAELPSIVTITFLVQTNVRKLDVRALYKGLLDRVSMQEGIPAAKGPVLVRLNTVDEASGTTCKRRYVENCFYNQVWLWCWSTVGQSRSEGCYDQLYFGISFKQSMRGCVSTLMPYKLIDAVKHLKLVDGS